MKKVISFGKIAYNSNKKENEVIIEIILGGEERPTLSICGEVWDKRHNDTIMCGQCLDELQGYFIDNWKFMEIYRLWNLYHLNNFHAGTIAQEELLKKYGIYDYKEACDLLKEHNLYEDNGYRYGSGWLYREIPSEDLAKIREIIETW